MMAAARNEIVERFLSRLDDVVERCTLVIFEKIPAYGRMSADITEDLKKAVRDNVATLAQVISRGREIRGDELEGIERVGARRAQQSIPLDDVLHAYRMVSRVCWDIVSEECRAQQTPDALEATIELAEAILRYTDQISTGVAQAYAKAQRAIVREREGARREFLADLLYGTEAPPEDILRRAHSFGYDLSLGYLALVGIGPEDDANKELSLSSAAARVIGEGGDSIVMQKGDVSIALLPMDPSADPVMVPEKLVAELSSVWCFGVGGPQPGLEGIRRAYLEAREALEIGLAVRPDDRVFRFDELLAYHFLRVEPALVERFVSQTLGPLLEYDERRKGELVKTLDAYFASDGSVKMAGERLFAHPHTVTYRLKQIEKLTGWSLRDPEDKLRLQLGLRAHRLAQVRQEGDDQRSD